jgi:heme/copper-type cytochrome/quinol oxidase subunit 2
MQTTTSDPAASVEVEQPSGWMRLARGGAIGVVAWSLLLQLTAGVVIPPVAVIGVVFLAFVPFLTGRRRRLGLAVAVAGVVSLVGNLEVVIDELANPSSTPAFVLTLLAVLGAATATIGGLGVFFGWSGERVRTVATASVATLAVGSMVSVVIGANTDSDAKLPADLAVIATQLQWEPTEIVFGSGDSALWIDNRDGVRHAFVVPELGIDVEIPGLKARRVDVSAGPGTYELICTVPGHEAMTGTLIVEG